MLDQSPGDRRAVEPLLPLLRSRPGDLMVRLVVANTLGAIGDAHALPALLEVLRDDKETDKLRARVAYAIGLIGHPAAIDTLVELLHADPDIAIEAAHALGRISGPRAIGPLVGLLRDNNYETTLAASHALIWIGAQFFRCLKQWRRALALRTASGHSSRLVVRT